MKNVVNKLVFAMALLVSFGIQAQNRKEKIKNATPEERVAMRTEKFSEKLGLDENQKTKVKEIFAAQEKENKVVKEGMKAEREKARTEMKETLKKQNEALKAKLKPVLTPEQFKKWETMQNENMEKMKEKRNERMENRKNKN